MPAAIVPTLQSMQPLRKHLPAPTRHKATTSLIPFPPPQQPPLPPSRCSKSRNPCTPARFTSLIPLSTNAPDAPTSSPPPRPSEPPPATPPPQPGQPNPKSDADASPATAIAGFQLNRIHVALFTLIFVGGALFATLTLQFTADMEFSTAIMTVLTRVTKSVAFRQLVVIGVAILLVRYCLNGALKALASMSNSRVEWDKTIVFYVLREVYQPLELLLLIAAICTVADTFVPSLISVSKVTVSRVVKTILSTSFIIGFSSVLFNIKSRFCKENAWQAEMKGDVTQQRRWEAYDKLGTFIIYVMTFVLAIQAIGLEVTSVLAIGGIGGLAIGLAGREICENLLNGFLIMSTNPFEVGDEIHFFSSSKVVEGFVIDIGWYRTQIRSFEREVFVIPNSVFSKNIVLNITRKNREFRFHETLLIRVQDVQKANSIIQDIRRIVRNDVRILNKLHRRIFLDKITQEDCRIYLSFYLEAANRDAFMAVKQDMLLAFVDVVERNGAKLATPRTMIEMDKDLAEVIGGVNPMLAGIAAAQSMVQAQHGFNSKAKRLPEVSTAASAAAGGGNIAEAEATTLSSVSGATSSGGVVGPPPSSGSSSGGTSSSSSSGGPAAAGAAAQGGSGKGAAKVAEGNGAAGAAALPSSSSPPPPPPPPPPLPSSSQSVPALPMSSSPVAFSPIPNNLPKAPASQKAGAAVAPTSTSAAAPDPSRESTTENLWSAPAAAKGPSLQAMVSPNAFGDVLLASFEDINGVFDNSSSFGDEDVEGPRKDSSSSSSSSGR